jgi:subtilisin family serine protease
LIDLWPDSSDSQLNFSVMSKNPRITHQNNAVNSAVMVIHDHSVNSDWLYLEHSVYIKLPCVLIADMWVISIWGMNMAKARGRRDQVSDAPEGTGASVNLPSATTMDGIEYTGRQLVLLREDSKESDLKKFVSASGVSAMMRASDFAESAIDPRQAETAEAIYFDNLKVVVMNAAPDQVARVESLAMSESDSNVLATEPERMNYHCGLEKADAEYLRGYRDAINHLADKFIGASGAEEESASLAAAGFSDTAQFTWGLQATRVNTSPFAGQGVKVAILDTGLDFLHPDFVGRVISQQSFIAGETAQDGHFHGTHCVGTSCGPRIAPPRRYGCAFGAEIFVGKVLSNLGSGPDQSILGGINWAINNGCRIVSMSLGSRVNPGDVASPVYEQVAQRALSRNTLIIAAAGNDSRRPGQISPVGRPANCPSILAVAAVNSTMGIAPFSCGGINPNGGGVDIAGPGVDIFSTSPMSTRYRALSGTSMATPHVAGIAALWLQARPTLSARGLWQTLVSNSLRLPLPARDVGAGLVQAPQSWIVAKSILDSDGNSIIERGEQRSALPSLCFASASCSQDS